MTCSSSLPGLPCSTARPAAEGACSWWGASSRASPLRRRTPHDHCPLGSTAPSPKTTPSVHRGTCVLPHAAGSGAGTLPSPAASRTPSNTPPVPVSTAPSGPLAPGRPPSGSWAGHAIPIAKAVPAVQSKPFFGHRRGRTLSFSPPRSSPAPPTKKCSFLSVPKWPWTVPLPKLPCCPPPKPSIRPDLSRRSWSAPEPRPCSPPMSSSPPGSPIPTPAAPMPAS